MATYVALYNWTDQGIRHVKETKKRYDAAVAFAEKMGVRLTHFLYTMGGYDMVAIIEAADEETMNAFSLALGSMGNVRSTTMRAYKVEDMARILSKI